MTRRAPSSRTNQLRLLTFRSDTRHKRTPPFLSNGEQTGSPPFPLFFLSLSVVQRSQRHLSIDFSRPLLHEVVTMLMVELSRIDRQSDSLEIQLG